MPHDKVEKQKRTAKYKTVDISSVRGHRRGKHHSLVESVILDLEVLESGQAIKVSPGGN